MLNILMLVMGTLGVSNAVATTIVNIILGSSTLVTIIIAITAVASSGLDAILAMGWGEFVATVKQLAAKSVATAVFWQGRRHTPIRIGA